LASTEARDPAALRDWFITACAAASGQEPTADQVLDYAAISYLLHMASLFHDDKIDGAETRRAYLSPRHLGHTRAVQAVIPVHRGAQGALAYSDLDPELINEAIELNL
jgi:geranylgeranyl pyrophosphate synthase